MKILLDTTQKSQDAQDFETTLKTNVIGQERAVKSLTSLFQVIKSGLRKTGRPLANLLLMGPTGVGKTRMAEMCAEYFSGEPTRMIKVNCAEFQHSHEIAKLVGSPPGYLGFREARPIFTQEIVDKLQTDVHRVSVVLFDEIEKAHDAMFQLLLGVLDKAQLTNGDNTVTDFSRCLIFLTSNLGSTEISKLMSNSLGFVEPRKSGAIDQDVYRVAYTAAKKKFTPEFMGRLDKVLVFRPLSDENMWKILELELRELVSQFIGQSVQIPFGFVCTNEAKAFLLKEGTDTQFGARHLKKVLERFITVPIAGLLASGQIKFADTITMDLAPDGKPIFFAEDLDSLLDETNADVVR